MSFEGEFAHYEPLRRVMSSEKVQNFINALKVRDASHDSETVLEKLTGKSELVSSSLQLPDLVLAIDGSHIETKVHKGYPEANFGCVTVASVLLNLEKIQEIEKQEFPNPRDVQNTESVTSFEAVFPGCNVIKEGEKDPKSFFRKTLYEELKNNGVFPDGGETLLETYEYLLDMKPEDARLPKSPIDGVDDCQRYVQVSTYRREFIFIRCVETA